jgi:hypothetical protein
MSPPEELPLELPLLLLLVEPPLLLPVEDTPEEPAPELEPPPPDDDPASGFSGVGELEHPMSAPASMLVEKARRRASFHARMSRTPFRS